MKNYSLILQKLNKIYKIFILIILFIYILYKINFYHIPKISIFIPIYNKEMYLRKSIKSIQRQSLKDIEIIAINDYSLDNSLNILKRIITTDSRLKIINNNKNYGLLYSRAMGILNSKGEYIMNLDPDDELLGNNSLQYLYKTAKKSKVDVVVFSYLYKNQVIRKCNIYNSNLKQSKILQIAFNKKNKLEDYVFWNKLIKKTILLKAYKIFEEKINSVKWNYHDDNIWSILIHKYAKSMICVKKVIYNYKSHADSLMHNKGNILELNNIIYRGEMFIKVFNKKEEEKFMIKGILQSIIIFQNKKFLSLLNNNIYTKKKLFNLLNICFSNHNCLKLVSPKIYIFIKKINFNI